MSRASCINAKPYKEQGWERKKRGEHSFLNGCSFRGAGITATKMKIGAQHEVLNVFSVLDLLGAAPSGAPLVGVLLTTRAKINVSEHQENDARNGSCGCVEMCFGYRASMRSPIESRAGRKNSRAPIIESL